MGKYPQEIYAAVIHAIQLEWIFIQLITNNEGDSFTGVEKMIQETSFASPFLWKVKISLTHCRNSKYNAVQEIRTGPPESRDVRKI